MSIIRVEKRREYTQVPNSTLRDKELSLDALGLLVRLLSYPNGWEIKMGYLQSQLGLGRHRLRRILRELENAKYINRTQNKNKEGRWEWDSVVSDTPIMDS